MTISVRDLDDKLRRAINWAKSGGVSPAEITTELNLMLTALSGDSSTHDNLITLPPAGLVPVSPPPSSVPMCTAAPAITGTVTVGQVLTCSNGTWTNSPSSYTYQWLRSGYAIGGATAGTYTLVAADSKNLVSCRVTAGTAAGAYGHTVTTVGPVP